MKAHLSGTAILQVLSGDADESTVEHAGRCSACAREVGAMRLVMSLPPAEETPEWLPRNASRASAVEDEMANYLVRPLLSADRFDASSFVENPRHHQAAVVQLLLEQSAEARESDPSFALRLTGAAILIAAGLTGTTAVMELRVAAWREHANALRYVGRYDEALSALDHAERGLNGLTVSAWEEGRIAFVRATVLWKQHRFEEALSYAERSRALFEELGEAMRLCDVLILQGAIAFDQRDFVLARSMYDQAFRLASKDNDAVRLARAHNNLAATHVEMGELRDAAEHFHSAITLFTHLDMKIERARVEWSLGLLSIRLGHAEDGLRRLECAELAMREGGSVADAALVAIDLVEHHLLSQDRTAARRVFDTIDLAGLPPHARTAMAVLARHFSSATPALLDVTRQHLRAEL